MFSLNNHSVLGWVCSHVTPAWLQWALTAILLSDVEREDSGAQMDALRSHDYDSAAVHNAFCSSQAKEGILAESNRSDDDTQSIESRPKVQQPYPTSKKLSDEYDCSTRSKKENEPPSKAPRPLSFQNSNMPLPHNIENRESCTSFQNDVRGLPKQQAQRPSSADVSSKSSEPQARLSSKMPRPKPPKSFPKSSHLNRASPAHLHTVGPCQTADVKATCCTDEPCSHAQQQETVSLSSITGTISPQRAGKEPSMESHLSSSSR